MSKSTWAVYMKKALVFSDIQIFTIFLHILSSTFFTKNLRNRKHGRHKLLFIVTNCIGYIKYILGYCLLVMNLNVWICMGPPDLTICHTAWSVYLFVYGVTFKKPGQVHSYLIKCHYPMKIINLRLFFLSMFPAIYCRVPGKWGLQ